MRGVKALRKVLVPKSIPFFTPFLKPVHKDSTPLRNLLVAWLLTLVFVLFSPFRKVVTPSLTPFLIMLFSEESLESLFMTTTLFLFPLGHCELFFHIPAFTDPVKAGDRVPWYGPMVGRDLVVHTDSLMLFFHIPVVFEPAKAGDRVPW